MGLHGHAFRLSFVRSSNPDRDASGAALVMRAGQQHHHRVRWMMAVFTIVASATCFVTR
jgi:hypothetical protein